jgi:branched-chain amino acid transport system substrate-binding protein
MAKKRTLIIIALVVIIAGIIIGIRLTQKPALPKEQVYKIGAILPLTGPSSSLGEWFRIGYILGEAEANATLRKLNNNIRIEVIIEDGRGDAKYSVGLYRKFVDIDRVSCITTTLSPISLAIKPLAISDRILFFGNAAHPAITGDSPLVFRHSNTVEQEGDLIARLIKEESPPPKKVLIFATNDDFGVAFRQYLASKLSDITHVTSDLYEREQTDFRSLISKHLKEQPDLLVVIGFVKSMGLVIKMARELGYEKQIIANFGFTDPNVVKLAASAAHGVYYSDYAFDLSKEPISTLNKMCLRKFGKLLPPVALLAYDTVMIIAEAIKYAGFQGESISSFILSKRRFALDGIQLNVTEKGDILPPLEMKRYE